VAANKVERKGAELREGLATIQREIQVRVASSVENLDTLHIQSVQELPDEVQLKIANRDSLRAQHARDLRSTMRDLLQEGIQPGQYIMDGSQGITMRPDVDNVVQSLSAKEVALESALADALERLHAYNTAARAGADTVRCEMGVHAPTTGARLGSNAEGSKCALASYSDWVDSYLNNGHARASDAAMLGLKTSLANDAAVVLVLGLQAEVGSKGREGDRLKTALDSAGSVIAHERQHQLTDALGVFPCTALLRAGRQLLVARRAECEALKRIVKVHCKLEKDPQVNDECLDGLGHRCKDKDDAVQKLRDARGANKKVTRALQMLTTAMDGGDREEVEGILQLMNLSNDMTLQDLRQRLRSSLNDLTTQTMQLTSEIQPHFPEVILYVGQGLPPDLGLLWQPLQSLDSFHEKELVESESRRKVWKVRLDQKWFAIKEYTTARASDLRTCLKEATVIHKQRHHAIVEIKALFQGTGSDTFYMQMQWYTHGSLDRWVRGDQRPDWRQVRSVLLDALLGLAHLHHNSVIIESR